MDSLIARRPLRKNHRKWLEEIARLTDRPGGMYPGLSVDDLPEAPAYRLCHTFGYITTFIPHNPIHKERWIVTDAGRAALAESHR